MVERRDGFWTCHILHTMPCAHCIHVNGVSVFESLSFSQPCSKDSSSRPWAQGCPFRSLGVIFWCPHSKQRFKICFQSLSWQPIKKYAFENKNAFVWLALKANNYSHVWCLEVFVNWPWIIRNYAMKKKENYLKKRVWFLPGNLQHRILTTPDHDKTCTFKKIYSGLTLKEVHFVFVWRCRLYCLHDCWRIMVITWVISFHGWIAPDQLTSTKN